VLEALEEQVVVLKLLAAARDPGTVTVRIGEENEDEQMRSTSVVSIGYGSDEVLLGGMGVVGPTRMDYPGTIAAVRGVAMDVRQILSRKCVVQALGSRQNGGQRLRLHPRRLEECPRPGDQMRLPQASTRAVSRCEPRRGRTAQVQ